MGTGRQNALGRGAEEYASRLLIERGLRPVARNFRRRGGEIDLIMLDDDTLVFVEVRYRASNRFLRPALTVDRRKQARLVRTAAFFAAQHPQHALRTMRFDVVAVEGSPATRSEWLRDAFRPGDANL